MEAYKKLKARKSKHTHIKPPKKDKKKPATSHAPGGAKPAAGAGAAAPHHEHRRPETVIDEEEVQERKIYSRRKVSSNAYRYELEEASAAAGGEGGDGGFERSRAPSLKELLENAASKDPSSHFRFREEREWNEIAKTAAHSKARPHAHTDGLPNAGLDFEKLGRSLATLPLAVRLQLEGDLFGQPVSREMTDDTSSSEESESEVEVDQVTKAGDKAQAKKTGERTEEIKAAQTSTRPSADSPHSPPSPAEATRPPLTVQREEQAKPNVVAQPDIDTDDLLEELLALPSDTDATATATPSGDRPGGDAAAPAAEGSDLESWLDSVI